MFANAIPVGTVAHVGFCTDATRSLLDTLRKRRTYHVKDMVRSQVRDRKQYLLLVVKIDVDWRLLFANSTRVISKCCAAAIRMLLLDSDSFLTGTRVDTLRKPHRRKQRTYHLNGEIGPPSSLSTFYA